MILEASKRRLKRFQVVVEVVSGEGVQGEFIYRMGMGLYRNKLFFLIHLDIPSYAFKLKYSRELLQTRNSN